MLHTEIASLWAVKITTVPWAFEVNLEVERAKRHPDIIEEYNEAYQQLEAQNPVTIGNLQEELRQKEELSAQAYRNIHEEILDHVVAKEWDRTMRQILREYFHFKLNPEGTILSGSNNTDRLPALRKWVS